MISLLIKMTNNVELHQDDPIVKIMTLIFQEKFGHPATFVGRAPGRVNLIGEHIDYCGFAVFPMALEGKFTTVLCRLTESGKIRCRNLNAQEFKDEDVPSVDPEAKLVDKQKPHCI